MKSYTIGIDIGGTNTDAVIIDDNNTIVATTKTTTTSPVADGFKTAITHVLKKTKISPSTISGCFVGSTHTINALLESSNLHHVGVLRLSGPATQSIPPCYGWPVTQKKAILCDYQAVNGGFEFDGKILCTIDESEIINTLEQFKKKGIESLAITGVYAPLYPEQEQEVLRIAQQVFGNEFPITCSSTISSVGFIERENATILNAALKKSMKLGFQALSSTLQSLAITCPLNFIQNNGTIMPFATALEFPILTLCAGPTNSFIGATKLAGYDNAIVIDIGGTSTDVGIVLDGFARKSLQTATIGGIHVNINMPDVHSVALGGGSIISTDQNNIKIGPKSVGKNLTTEILALGGNKLTLTDVALKSGFLTMPQANINAIQLSDDLCAQIMQKVKTELSALKSNIAGIRQNLPIILVGGGALLFQNSSLGKDYVIPENAGIANAYGAALAEISATIDTVVSLEKRDEMLQQIEQNVIEKTRAAGVEKATVRIVQKDIVNFNYLPRKQARVRIMAAGKRSKK